MLTKITFVTSYSRKTGWAFYPTGRLAPPYPIMQALCVRVLWILKIQFSPIFTRGFDWGHYSVQASCGVCYPPKSIFNCFTIIFCLFGICMTIFQARPPSRHWTSVTLGTWISVRMRSSVQLQTYGKATARSSLTAVRLWLLVEIIPSPTPYYRQLRYEHTGLEQNGRHLQMTLSIAIHWWKIVVCWITFQWILYLLVYGQV